MLRPAILLDASMTVRQALDRLARHGYWLDPSHPGAKEHLEEWIRDATAVAAAGSDGGEGSEQADDAPVATAAIPDLAEAARLLGRPLDTGRVAIRREEATTVFWYAMPVEAVLHALLQSTARTTLRVALGLQEGNSVPAVQVQGRAPADIERGVALRGHVLVGVGEPASTPKSAGGSRGIAPGAPAMAERGVGQAAPAAPPRVEAYPDVAIPSDVVVVGVPFDVDIGLRDDPAPGQTAASRMVITGRLGWATIPVEVQVVAEGFDAPDGWKRTLEVDPDAPTKARVSVRLQARSQDTPTRQTAIIVQYAVDGVTCGTHSRHVVVTTGAASPPPSDARGVSWTGSQPRPPALTLGMPLTAPDVELNIAKPDGNPASSEYWCTMRNAHGIPVPDEPKRIWLGGDDASAFAKRIIDNMRIYDGRSLLRQSVGGNGRLIASKLPPEFWQMLHAVAAKVTHRPLTLQLNSAEPYVPWELATVEPPIDPARPPMLAAQVAMGRWLLGDSQVAAPPRDEVRMNAMAAMAGQYKPLDSGMRALPAAEAEVKALKEKYRAVPYKCTDAGLTALLTASAGGAEIVHFAGHGLVNPTQPGDAAIYLEDGTPIDPILFLDSTLGKEHAPFVFFNACMVGTGGELLGSAGGFPGNCLAGGFSALVAPLWAVDDNVASWMALTFYDEALSDPPRPVADVLRELRGRFADDPKSSSYLAYAYYGNPHLRVARA